MNLFKKLFKRKLKQKQKNLAVAFKENLCFSVDVIKQKEEPSLLIKTIQDRQIIYDLIPKVNRALINATNIDDRLDGYLSDDFTVYQTEEGVIHSVGFVDNHALSQFKKGLRLLGYNPIDSMVELEEVKLHLYHQDENPGLLGKKVKKMARDFYDLYSFDFTPRTKTIKDVKPVSKLEEIALEDVEKAKNHSRWLTNPGVDIFVTNSLKYESRDDTPLVAVHATNYLPKEGRISPGGPSFEIAGRRTIHFSLNGLATAGEITSSDTWKDAKYFIVAPLADLLEHNKPYGGVASDFFFPGPVTLPETTQVFTSRNEAENYISKIGRLRAIGKNDWSGDYRARDLSLSKALNIWSGLHDSHWTRNYERIKENGSHEDALDYALEIHDSYYPIETEKPSIQLKQSRFLKGLFREFIPGRKSKKEARSRLSKELSLVGFNLPNQV